MKKYIFAFGILALFFTLPAEAKKADALPYKGGIYDMHEHFRKSGSMDTYLRSARQLGVRKTVFVPTGIGPDNGGYKEHMKALLEARQKHPSSVIAFCTVDEADPAAPSIFEACLKKGGKGLKLLVGHPNFYDAPIDSEIMKQLFAVAKKYDVPVMVHVSIITNPKAKQEFKNLLDQFPEVRVQFAHYCSTIYDGINLDQCEEFLDAYPNLYIDLSMGGGLERYLGYFQQDIQKVRDFIIKYQDRIFYGTDMIVAPPSSPTTSAKWIKNRMLCDLRLHQLKEYECPSVAKKAEWKGMQPGFELPQKNFLTKR
ncbi:amidohydrolase family protein [Candidatus Peregrinibacteria bacterium]|nr:amidohydrolase family protein [Candidatus Peregrinibacteria bacterium]